jgi:hypothetical protein
MYGRRADRDVVHGNAPGGQRTDTYTETMAEEQGNPISPESLGMPPGTSSTTEVTVVLYEVNDGTRVTLTHAGVPTESGAARGWNGAFDKLATELRAATGSEGKPRAQGASRRHPRGDGVFAWLKCPRVSAVLAVSEASARREALRRTLSERW